MIGLQRLGQKVVKVVDDSHIVSTKYKTGETALLQLNDKLKQFDCLVLKDGKVIEEYVITPNDKNKTPVLKLMTWFCDRLKPLLEDGVDIQKLMREIIKKSI